VYLKKVWRLPIQQNITRFLANKPATLRLLRC